MSIEHKSVVTEIKANIEDNTFQGYAASFNNIDSYGDVITPGAFLKTIEERGEKVRVLWNHNSNQLPIAIPQTMKEDKKGLYVTAKFSQITLAQDVRTLMLEGAIDSMSIGYSVVKADYGKQEDQPVRFLRELKLYEFSPVTFPANSLAEITNAKNSGDLDALLKRLDDMIAVDIQKGRPLSGENLKAARAAYLRLKSVLDDIHEEEPESGEGAGDDEALIHTLKSISLTTAQGGEVKAIEAEIAAVIRNIRFS